MLDSHRADRSVLVYTAVVVPVILPFWEPDDPRRGTFGDRMWDAGRPYVDERLGMSPGLYPTAELDPVCQARVWITHLGCLTIEPGDGDEPASIALVQTVDPDRLPEWATVFEDVDPGTSLIVETIVDLPTHRALIQSVRTGAFMAALADVSIWELVTRGLPTNVSQDDKAPLRARLAGLTVSEATKHWTPPRLGRATSTPMPTQGMVVTICSQPDFGTLKRAYRLSSPEPWGADAGTMPAVDDDVDTDPPQGLGREEGLLGSVLRKMSMGGQDHVAGWVTTDALDALCQRMGDHEYHPSNDHEIDVEEKESVYLQIFALAFLLSTLADSKCQMERWRMWLTDAYTLLKRTKDIAGDKRSRTPDGGSSDIEQECMVLLMDINDYRIDNWRMMRDLDSGQVASDTTCGGLSPRFRAVMTGWIAEQPTPTTIVEDSHSLMSSWMQSRLTYWSRMSARQSARTARLLQVASAVLGMVALLGLSAAIAAVPQSDTVFYPWVRAVFVTVLIGMALVVFALVIWKLIDMAPPRPTTRKALGALSTVLVALCVAFAVLGALAVINTVLAVISTIVTLIAASLLILFLLDTSGRDRAPGLAGQGLAD